MIVIRSANLAPGNPRSDYKNGVIDVGTCKHDAIDGSLRTIICSRVYDHNPSPGRLLSRSTLSFDDFERQLAISLDQTPGEPLA